MSDQAVAKPVPEPTLDTQPYWDGLRAGKLLIQSCARCGKLRFYPRPMCDACYSMDGTWVEASGKGTVHSWTVTHHPFHAAFKGELPYILATVDLAEGVRMNAQVRGIDQDALRIGLPVQIGFEAADGLSLPVIKPAG
jgi:uncharacterized OB-fold protein